jgi:hypothetical protein
LKNLPMDICAAQNDGFQVSNSRGPILHSPRRLPTAFKMFRFIYSVYFVLHRLVSSYFENSDPISTFLSIPFARVLFC